jgi:hypothetical protein
LGNPAEKFVSLFLDSASLYVERASLSSDDSHGCSRHSSRSRTAFSSVRGGCGQQRWRSALQVALYVPFDDLLPNGLYRYFNYHYFRWAFWLGFMMIPASVASFGSGSGCVAGRSRP